jgi:cyanophycinase
MRTGRGTKSVPTPIALLVAGLTLAGVAAAAAQAPPAPKGHLVVVGGGGVPDVVQQRALQLAGGPTAPVVVLPQASELADTGDVACEMWRKAGATSCRWLNLRDLAADRKAVDAAALIWFPGGDQNNLTKALAGTPLPEAIRARYAAGAVVGGTSAGAAVMSSVMITGDADLQSLTAGATKTAPGFALWPDAIVDQHFLKRQRHSRLVSLVLEHPALVGVGIDERTAAIVSDGRVDVMGESTVVIYDARKAVIEPRTAGQHSAARHVTMHVLTNGMGWDSR